MKYVFLAFTTAVAVIGAILCTIMGLDYIDPEIGRGLHPLIAFPLATMLICLVIVVVLRLTSSSDDPDDYVDQDEAINALADDGIYLKR